MEEKELTLSINEGVGCGERNGRDSFQYSIVTLLEAQKGENSRGLILIRTYC